MAIDPDRPPSDPPGTPRWVKLSGGIAIAIVLVVIVLLVAGGGEHGPGRHLPGGGDGGHTPPVHSP